MTPRTFFIPALDETEARVIAEFVARGETSSPSFHSARADVELICAHLNRSRADGRPHYQTFEVEVRQTTTHDGRIMVAWAADKVGDVAATAALFAYGAAVAFASTWEAWV